MDGRFMVSFNQSVSQSPILTHSLTVSVCVYVNMSCSELSNHFFYFAFTVLCKY